MELFRGVLETLYLALGGKVLKCLEDREILCGHRQNFSIVATVQVFRTLRAFFSCLYSIVNDQPLVETSWFLIDQMVRMLHLYTNPQATNQALTEH